MSHVHILGIGGTFMAGLALIAREAGYRVTGQDQPLYPPMSEVLARAGIDVETGYTPSPSAEAADEVIIGNALGRGNPAVEAILAMRRDYTSGPAWLARHILHDSWVIAVAGTHGKTTTAAMLAWMLESAGLAPGFLIGGRPANFDVPARLGQAPFFVIEADEYDTAFFDKRAKFVHFRPRTLVLNNLEFDHADIYPDLAAIERQFHHLIRTVPGNGSLVVNGDEPALERVLATGCWTDRVVFGRHPDHPWRLDGTAGAWQLGQHPLPLPQPGAHNAMNAAAATLAARHVGVAIENATEALADFRGVARRLELRGEVNDIRVVDDFAHHPTAIAATLEALRTAAPDRRLVAVVEPRSNTMREGVHADRLGGSLQKADRIHLLADPSLDWDVRAAVADLGSRARVADGLDALVAGIMQDSRPGDTIAVMSNGAFGGIHERLIEGLTRQTQDNAQ
ncbi:UDP-N-acetylmuramate:L-alanyl-gamma-D-glutamyl-meso-diaminopimelate ligase [Spiribacter pallidus]|uniref:UDP-N-acetylmuramate:L-alanyl-gamma-D-glutamyl- meso-diaminopimelate ligase n=1 Tax=Spiribacter pallidus TaxID=1987936 RepID=UPI0034A04A08